MPDPKANERMARKRQRDREEKGIVTVLVRVHHTRKSEIREIAATMREEAKPSQTNQPSQRGQR